MRSASRHSASTSALSGASGASGSWNGAGTASGSVSRSDAQRAASALHSGTPGWLDFRPARDSRASAASSRIASVASPSARPPATSRRRTQDSAGASTAVIAGTSAIAKAPFMVCTARSSASSAVAVPAAAASSQPSTTTRCPVTSVSRISSSSSSTWAGTITGAGVASSAWVASASASTVSGPGPSGSAGAASCSAACSCPGADSPAGVARSGDCGIASSPAAMRSASASRPARSTSMLCSPFSAASRLGSAWNALSTTARTAGVGARLPSSTRLSRLSTFQLNSPRVRAPTRRPLPLSVWNTRRIGRRRSISSGAPRHGGSRVSRLSISSANSSRKTSRISSSISSPVASKPPLAPTVIGAGASAAAASPTVASTASVPATSPAPAAGCGRSWNAATVAAVSCSTEPVSSGKPPVVSACTDSSGSGQ